MNIGDMLLALLDPGISQGFWHALAVIFNLAFTAGGITLLAYLCRSLSGNRTPANSAGKRPPARYFAVAIAAVSALIGLYVFDALDSAKGTAASGSYSVGDLLRFFIALLDPLLDIRHLADSPFQDLFGLNLVARAFELHILAAALQIAIKKAGETAVRFDLFLKDTLLAPPSEEGNAAPGEETAKTEVHALLERLLKILLSGGGAVFAAFVLGTDSMRDNISDVLDAMGKVLEMTTLLPHVGQNGTGVSGFFSDTLLILLSMVMLAVYTTAALLLIIFIHTIIKHWPDIVAWVAARARQMRKGTAVVLLTLLALAALVGVGICLQKYPILHLNFPGGPTAVLKIAVQYAAVLLAVTAVLSLLAFAISFVLLVANYAARTVESRVEAWKGSFGSEGQWRAARAAACVILSGALLAVLAISYPALRSWLAGIFYPEEGVLLPTQAFRLAAMLALLLEGLVLLASTAVALGFILFGGMVDFFRTAKKAVVSAASRLVKETLATILDTISVLPFLLKQLCLVAKSTIRTVLQIFTGYRTESDKNNAIFIAACFASLASLLNTFLGLYGFYGGQSIVGRQRVIPTICTLAIACAVQLIMLVIGMKAGEGLAEWRITQDGAAKSRLLRILSAAALLLSAAAAGCFAYVLVKDILQNGFHLEAVPLLAGAAICLCLCFYWLRKRRAPGRPRGRRAESETASLPSPAEVPADILPRRQMRLPFYWYLVVYLLLLVVSTGFAYSNLFGYYAHGARIHDRVYSQVRYEAAEKLDLSGRVAAVTVEYDEVTRRIESRFRQRTALVLQERDSKQAVLRQMAEGESSGYTLANRRDRFIGETKDLETVIATIYSLLDAEYDDIGSNAVILTEEYDHYWGFSAQPSYQTTCILIDLSGSGCTPGKKIEPEACNVITVGDWVKEEEMSTFPETAHADLRGKALPEGRIKDPANPSQSIIKNSRTKRNADKYSILKELLSQYERLENTIYNFDTGASTASSFSSPAASAIPSLTPPVGLQPPVHTQMLSGISGGTGTTVSDLLYPGLDRLSQLDGIRGNIVRLYREGDSGGGGQNGNGSAPVPMQSLPYITEAYLSADGDQSGEAGETNEPTNTPAALTGYNSLSGYIDRALAVDSVLQSFDTTAEEAGNTPSTEASPAYTVQKYRNYAQGIAHLDFQISYDALLHGHLHLNPVREDISALYTASTIALFLLLICVLIDLMAFFSGLLLFKSIYMFGKNAGLIQMGYLNYETALSNLFMPPSDPHGRVLHLAYLYSVVYGDASVPAETEEDAGNMLTEEPAAPDGNVPSEESTAPNGDTPKEDSAAPDGDAPEENSSAAPADDTPEESGPAAESVEQQVDHTSTAVEAASFTTAAPADGAEAAAGRESRAAKRRRRAEEAQKEKAEERFRKTEAFFQDMDILHRIMRSEDYQQVSRNMSAVLTVLGITGTAAEDPDGDYASLQLWLHDFIEENRITFEELFPPEAE